MPNAPFDKFLLSKLVMVWKGGFIFWLLISTGSSTLEMRQSYNLTAVVQHEDHWYTALCPEPDIASQGKTVEEARDNLTEALELFLECANASEIQRRLSDEVYVTRLEVAVA